MMRTDFWNESTARQLSPPITHGQVNEKRDMDSSHKHFPAGEKLLYLGSVIFCVFCTLIIISKHARVTEFDFLVRKMETRLHEMSKVKLQLETERVRLSSIDHIRGFAESKGLELSLPRALPKIHP